MFPGVGTLVNVATVLLGATIGVLLGHRLPERTRDVVTDALGLVTLLIAGLSAVAVTDDELTAYAGTSAPMLVVLASMAIGGIIGSLLRLEARVESLGGWLQTRLSGDTGSVERQRFIEGFVVSSLVFCTGPLTILGSLNDGLGLGADQLILKATLDGFAAIAFAASFGWGVAASALTVLVIQGGLTGVGTAPGRRAARRPHRRRHGGRRAAARRRRPPTAAGARDPRGRPAPRAPGGSLAADGGGGIPLAGAGSATPGEFAAQTCPSRLPMVLGCSGNDSPSGCEGARRRSL